MLQEASQAIALELFMSSNRRTLQEVNISSVVLRLGPKPYLLLKYAKTRSLMQ
jgi:hypothetical protein